MLATFAGLSTTIGGAIAVCIHILLVHPPPLTHPSYPPSTTQVLKRPGDALMAYLLGLAFGVMFLLSVWELWIHAAMEYGFWPVTLPVMGGALLYIALQPLLPTFGEDHAHGGATTVCVQCIPLTQCVHHPQPTLLCAFLVMHSLCIICVLFFYVVVQYTQYAHRYRRTLVVQLASLQHVSLTPHEVCVLL